VWDFIRKQVKQGRQAYIVYPVIEGSKDDQPELDFSHDEPETALEPPPVPVRKSARKGKTAELFPKAQQEANPTAQSGLKSAVEMYEKLRTGSLAGLRIGLLHGRLDADEKEIVMRRSSAAKSMCWLRPPSSKSASMCPTRRHGCRTCRALRPRQMHQLRGRVGRGAAKSYCILMTGQKVSPLGEERLNAMVRTQDGFELAELDLSQRGPGEFFGTRQAGLPDFRVANLVRDRQLLELAKLEAARFANPPSLDQAGSSETTEPERARVWARLKDAWQRRYGLVEAG